jgi:hypothetical protein
VLVKVARKGLRSKLSARAMPTRHKITNENSMNLTKRIKTLLVLLLLPLLLYGKGPRGRSTSSP